jgi:MULE transposase domain/SWIM zinc finger
MSATNPSHSSAIIGHSVSEPSSGRSHSSSENLAENDAGIAVSAPNLRQRGVWVVANSVLPTNLSAELEKYAPSRVCETKCDKTYYRCPMRNRFKCPFVLRTIKEEETGSIIIESNGSKHKHDDSSEQFIRGLSTKVKENIMDIAKFNLKIRPRTLHRRLLAPPYSYAGADVPLSKVSSYLHRIRSLANSSYLEYSISGLFNFVSSKQRATSSTDESSFYFTENAESSIINPGSEDARVQVFASTDTLLKVAAKIYHTAAVMQLVVDSKHRVLMNNYPVTAVGFLDAGQQFNLVMLAVSNKEDEEFFCSLIQSLQNALASCSIAISVECTMSDNCSAIQHALHQYYPNSLAGNCKFHLLQNIKKKRSMWNINVPETIPASQKSKFIVRARDACEKFAMESIRWLSSIAFEHDFTICADLFLTKLEAQGHEVMSNVLRNEYFHSMKRGWARAFMPCGSASTNNSLESFNGNALSRDIVGGTRTTMAQLFRDLEGFFRSQSEEKCSHTVPITPLDVGRNVAASSQMLVRVKEWYAKAIALATFFDESALPLFRDDDNGGFYVISGLSKRGGESIDTLLAGQMGCIQQAMVACSEAGRVMGEWRNMSHSLAEVALKDSFNMLQRAIIARDLSYYHVRFIPPQLNKSLIHAREVASVAAADLSLQTFEREIAISALNSNKFLYLGVLNHACSCPNYHLYNACKHALWATMHTTHQDPPRNVDPRPLAGRRRAGRPRGIGRALETLPNAQNPAI